MINFSELEIGHYYSRGDDASYKVVDKGSDWVLVLSYSHNHCVVTPRIFNKTEIDEDIFYTKKPMNGKLMFLII